MRTLIPIDKARQDLYGEKFYAASRIVLMVQVLAESGIQPTNALQSTGLSGSDLENPYLKVSMHQIVQTLTNLVTLDPRSDVGLRLGMRIRASTYGMLGYALLCSPTLRSAFDTAVRFQRLSGGIVNAGWILKGDRAVWFPLGEDEECFSSLDPRFFHALRDFHVGILVRVTKDVMGDWCRPALARFAGAPPNHLEALTSALECPIEFEQPRNELHYPANWLERSPQLANAISAAEISNTCAALLEQLTLKGGIKKSVHEELTRLPGKFPDIEQVATNLCMTSRTLRRRLASEGTTYRHMLDEVRLSLAHDYLKSSLSVEDVTSALGFGSASAFRRAFRRWTGESPTEIRQRS